MKGDFDKAGIQYTTVSIDEDAGSKEMWGFLQLAGHKGAVGLPVVNMYGVCKIQAEATVEAVN